MNTSTILIKDVEVVGRRGRTSVYIEDGKIVELGEVKVEAERVFKGNYVLSPAFYNTHTHAAMTLFRGYGDDMELQEWLTTKIWPKEANLREEDIYWGTRLAAIEMIHSGTVAFADMYFYVEAVGRAVVDQGVRALISGGFIDLFDEDRREREIKTVEAGLKALEGFPRERVRPSLGPHAVYTVSKEGFEYIRDKADETGYPIQIHLLETREELEEFLKEHGTSPIRYLQELGILRRGTITAHSVHLTDDEIRTLSRIGVYPSHCPISNMKLSVKGIMPAQRMINSGIKVTLGTDGAASNNSLNMLEEMKFAALLAKGLSAPTDLPAETVFKMATEWGAEALGFRGGRIEEGYDADLLLFRKDHYSFTPGYNFTSDIVYSATPSSLDTVICLGEVLMEGGVVEGEEDVINKAREVAYDLIQR
ncbi:MAG: amidohydrolase [Thermoplasmata archaeon]|nr:amidohydrolase [Thermoplasmata archaeon]